MCFLSVVNFSCHDDEQHVLYPREWPNPIPNPNWLIQVDDSVSAEVDQTVVNLSAAKMDEVRQNDVSSPNPLLY